MNRLDQSNVFAHDALPKKVIARGDLSELMMAEEKNATMLRSRNEMKAMVAVRAGVRINPSLTEAVNGRLCRNVMTTRPNPASCTESLDRSNMLALLWEGGRNPKGVI